MTTVNTTTRLKTLAARTRAYWLVSTALYNKGQKIQITVSDAIDIINMIIEQSSSEDTNLLAHVFKLRNDIINQG